MNKYRNKKITVDGQTFDSKKEYRIFCQLELLQKAGEIYGLERQVKYQLLPPQREPDVVGPRGGRKPGKLLEKGVDYYADFRYTERNGQVHVLDVKSAATRKDKAYILKRKMMLYLHGVRIEEV